MVPRQFVEIIEDVPIDMPMEGWDAILPKLEGTIQFNAPACDTHRSHAEGDRDRAGTCSVASAVQASARFDHDAITCLTTCAAAALFEVKALFDFPKENEGDLAFHAGDVITVTEQIRLGVCAPSFALMQCSAEWYCGTLHGRTGIFPAAFVGRACHKCNSPS